MRSLEEILLDQGYEGTVYLTEEYYDKAAVGVSDDGRVIYDFDLLVDVLVGGGHGSH